MFTIRSILTFSQSLRFSSVVEQTARGRKRERGLQLVPMSTRKTHDRFHEQIPLRAAARQCLRFPMISPFIIMKCPICKLDLEPLDLVSRSEHVDLCIENGPSVVEVDETGRLVVKKNIPPGKQRKICLICDKTFQNLHHHFKTCALKHDVPPDLMLDYWDKINAGEKKPKKFPRDLLDSFVAKCIREGRVGDQVDFARALSMSMADGPESHNETSSTVIQEQTMSDGQDSMTSIAEQQQALTTSALTQQQRVTTTRVPLAVQVRPSGRGVANRPKEQAKTYRLQMVDDAMKKANVALRIDRELAAARSKRYLESSRQLDQDCLILDENFAKGDFDKLFNRAQMKACDGSASCLASECVDHELLLLIDEFKIYSGPLIDAPATLPRSERTAATEVHKNDLLTREAAHGPAADFLA